MFWQPIQTRYVFKASKTKLATVVTPRPEVPIYGRGQKAHADHRQTVLWSLDSSIVQPGEI